MTKKAESYIKNRLKYLKLKSEENLFKIDGKNDEGIYQLKDGKIKNFVPWENVIKKINDFCYIVKV